MAEDIRVCFVGDSFVNGTGDEAALGWTGRVCASVNHSGTPLTYYNLGIRRDTSLDILQRWQNECSRRLPANADGRIVFSFGVNDTVFEDGAPRIAYDQSIANFRQILLDSKMYKVLVVGPPPVSDAAQNERIRCLSEAYAQEAKLLEIPYIALFQPLINDHHHMVEIAGNDGSHPQGTGYGKMAGIVGTSVDRWFSQAI